VNGARRALPCTIRTLQSDHGSAFSKWFTKQVAAALRIGIRVSELRMTMHTWNGSIA
jgi:hypothetical protein